MSIVIKKTHRWCMVSSAMALFVAALFFVVAMSGCNKVDERENNPLKSLADTSGNFALPNKSNKITFPAAHAPHKAYRQEWWYLTANLTTDDGQIFATQWTLFRRAVEQKHWYFAHAALANNNHHLSAYRDGREELGNVVINTEPFDARIDDWRWHSERSLLPAQLSYGSHLLDDNNKDDNSTDRNNEQRNKLNIEQDKNSWQVRLNLSEQAHYYLQGEQGFSQKHHQLNIASHYYSQPFIDVQGDVFWQNKWQKVSGKAWLDREWGSRMLAADQQGWDWFSLRLDNNTALMVYRIRSEQRDYLYGSVMKQGGDIRTLSEIDVNLVEVKKAGRADGKYPQSFKLSIIREGIDIDVNVVNPNQVMRFGIEYFEGMVTFSGSHQGEGFLEMTGYQ